MNKANHPTFAECIEMMRTGNPQVAEDGAAYIRPHAKNYVIDLMGEFERETNHAMQCWLLELIGEARSDRAFGLLKREATAADGAIREWARRGLERLDTHASRTFLLQLTGAALE